MAGRAARVGGRGRADLLLANSYHLVHDRKDERIEGPFAPLGPLYIAATMRKQGLVPGYYDGTFSPGVGEFRAQLQRERPMAVGIYATVISRHVAVKMGGVAKNLGIPVIAGGPDPSSAPQVYLNSGNVDVVVKGEGEQAGIDLARHFAGDGPELEKIPGLFFRRDGKDVFTGERPFIADLDTIPYPARDLTDWRSYADINRRYHGHSETTVMTSRGCPFQCTWCCKPIFGGKYRHRSAKNVVGEMLELKARYRPEMIRFADDIFTINRRKFLELADEIERQDAVIPFECLSRVDLVDREILARLRDIGCRKILYGVESGSQRVLDSMKKGITVEEVREISAMTREFGMGQYWFLIYGFPPEDLEDLRKTVELVRRFTPDDYGITVAYPLPGTEFFDQVRESMHEGVHWERTRDNLVLYRTKYGHLFYRTAILGTRLVYTTKRIRDARPHVVAKAVDRLACALFGSALGAFARVRDGA